MIELKGINKIYDDGFQALKDIDLTFEEGKINVLIGPSGCGKTTTMKLLNRLTDYTDGDILIDDQNMKQINPFELRRQMGYVIQNIGLFPHMSIFDNVATVPKLLKWNKHKIRERVDELLNMVNLDPETYRNRYPAELSGGQQQRIGVIRALAAEPSTILMDEPFSALDPISREQLQDELTKLQQEINKTIIFVTHDMDEAIKIADQIILMKDGEIVQKGAPQEILANPANEFVTEFIGEDRLENVLPSIQDMIQSDYPSISLNTTVEQSIQLLSRYQISDIPVVDENGAFNGIVNLFDLLNNKRTDLKTFIHDTLPTITENMDSHRLMQIFHEHKSTVYPIQTKEGNLAGVVERKQLVHLLHQFYMNKSGDSEWSS
ncbi:betaine/proline/choline family ABC transporter ATP-binding protein [Lentibacillus salicampi]|uniref:Quaternary amine transport ATP-binding protein n=1 Tax=Lentibacillus salicampi TaxID=175306 RepID=A0A4Y9ADP3_9BACI|nr:betaine/proline/choline family ABC transporter ATP-binding protein [Lentibacillus salicampi]TFJ93070.1 ATP-binding cassette domain-containing protein [Lentibacillus salicampi]